MISNAYCIISETSEDRFDETVSPEEAVPLLATWCAKVRRESRFPLSIGARSSGNWSLLPMTRWKKRWLVDEG
jgi:hypothetical protein